MIKKHLLGGALLVSVLVLLTGCKEMMSSLDNPVSAYFEVTPTQATIVKNQTCQIKYSTISDGKVTFKSSAENIATVDANGLVTAKTAGTAIITVELAATPYYQGATKNVEISVDAVLSIDATEVTVGYGASINLVKDYHLARKGDATINYEIIEGGEFITLDETTKDITGKACGNAKVKVSVPASATASSDELVIDVKARVQDLDQLKKVIAASDDVTALLSKDFDVTLTESLDLTGKKVTIKGDEKTPAIINAKAGIITTNALTVSNVKFKVDDTFKGNNALIKMNTLPTSGLNDKGCFEIDNMTFDGVIVENLRIRFFWTNTQAYYIKNFTFSNGKIAVMKYDSTKPSDKQKNIFDFQSGGFPQNINILNSTIYYADTDAAVWQKGNFISAQSGKKPGEATSETGIKQTFTIVGNTLYKICNNVTSCSFREKDKDYQYYVIKDNKVADCDKENQFIVGIGQGSIDSKKLANWQASGNIVNWGGKDVYAEENTKCGIDNACVPGTVDVSGLK